MAESRLMQPSEAFTRFLEDYRDKEGSLRYDKALGELAVRGSRSFVVDFNDLYSFDVELAKKVLDDPEQLLSVFSDTILQKLRLRDPTYAENVGKIHIRLRNLPKKTPLRGIGAEHLGRLVMSDGIIVRASPVEPMVERAGFRCSRCGELNMVRQSGRTLKRPDSCLHCENRRGFELEPMNSDFVDSQRATVQERPEDLPPGQLPRSLDVELRDDLVDDARPGDRVSLVGVLDLVQRYGRGGALRTYDLALKVNHLEVSGRELEAIEFSEEDEEEMLELSREPKLHRRLLNSVAPSIYGHEEIKEAVLCLLFGGVEKQLPDMRIRGDVNVLIVGDPGTGKSQMLSFTAKAAPRGLLTTGRGSTAAGLTAAVVRESGTGGFTLEAGALVLADKGVCCIDEMDKMREEDRAAIHPAMEQQQVSIAKGGIVATLNSRASILAAANPTMGRYNPYQTIADNINLPVTILSRFDLIYILKDEPEEESDRKMARHILGLHRSARSIKNPETPPLDTDKLRKYISYARQLKPILKEEAVERLRDFYVKMRTASLESGEVSAVSITPRQLESLVRLAEARARSELREEVSVKDAEEAIRLMRTSLRQVGVDTATGEVDIDIIYTGKPRSLQNRLQTVLAVIRDMESTMGVAEEDELYNTLREDHAMERSEASKLINLLRNDGVIYMPRPRRYRTTN